MLIALLVLFVPMFFSGSPPAPGGDQTVSLAIPPAPDRDLQTRTMSLNPNAPAVAATAASVPAQPVTAPPSGQLPTVNIGSNRPRDVGTDSQAGVTPAAPTVITGSGASPSQPLIPQQPAGGAPKPVLKPQPVAKSPGKPVKAPPQARVAAPAPPPAAVEMPVAGQDSYTLNLSAYASAAGAASLQRRVRALGYPVTGHAITQAGKSRTLVIAGPFGTRTAAEAARLKITQSIPGVPARLEQDASHESSTPDAAAPAASGGKPGGWAVQLAAMSSQADANALRDKLRANGFDGFVDSVQSGGMRLWRVRAGPQTQRADAQRLHDQIKAKLGMDGNVVSVP